MTIPATNANVWLLRTLDTLRPGAQWSFREEFDRGSMGCIVCTDVLTDTEVAVSMQTVSDRDPVGVLDRLYCCACGVSVMFKVGTSGEHYAWYIEDPMRPPLQCSRSICRYCATQIGADRCDRLITARNQALGVQPTSLLWTRGSYGACIAPTLRARIAPVTMSLDAIDGTGGGLFTGGDTCPISVTSTEEVSNQQRRKAKEARTTAHRRVLLSELSRKVPVKP